MSVRSLARDTLSVHAEEMELLPSPLSGSDTVQLLRHDLEMETPLVSFYLARDNEEKQLSMYEPAAAGNHSNLSEAEVEILWAYWEHRLFRVCRFLSLLFVLVGIVIATFSVAKPFWLTMPSEKNYTCGNETWNDTEYTQKYCSNNMSNFSTTSLTIRISLFYNCTTEGVHNLEAEVRSSIGNTLKFESNDTDQEACDFFIFGVWQYGVIGGMAMSCVFGILAIALAVSGICARSIAQRIYYYHSAAEVLFVSALLSGLSLALFSLMTKSIPAEDSTPEVEILLDFSYGHGYWLAWSAVACYFVSAVLMNLDVFIMCTVPNK